MDSRATRSSTSNNLDFVAAALSCVSVPMVIPKTQENLVRYSGFSDLNLDDFLKQSVALCVASENDEDLVGEKDFINRLSSKLNEIVVFSH